ncbi:ABC transporter permease [Candidatus Njordibacter sp. Uisw_058]|uniref:ABC transporter permease n=1 Tax=Candidatus Njordibacter sp. Uisw_058 TaxID=3230974 RepID=UPI003D562CF3
MTQFSLPKSPKQVSWPSLRVIWYRSQNWARNPTVTIGIILSVFAAYLILAPVIMMLMDAFTVDFADQARASKLEGELTSYYLNRAMNSPIAKYIFWLPLMNTLFVSIVVIIATLLVGGLLGWLVSRTDLLGKRWFSTALIVPYMVPSWTFALAWMAIFKNRTMGGLPGWLENLGFTPPDWLSYGFFPIAVILSLHYVPFVVLLVGNALRQFDSQLEESARTLGASSFQVARRIVFPLLRPSIISAATLVFAKCLGDVGVTYIIGAPVKLDLLATSLLRTISTGQDGMSAVLAGTIVILGTVSVLIDMKLLKAAQRFVTIGSKGSLHRTTVLGKWKWPAFGFASSFVLIGAIIPFAALLLTTVMRMPGIFSWDNFTLEFWVGRDLITTALPQGILITKEFWVAAWNTVWMVGLASIGAGVLGLMVGYIVARSPFRLLGGFLKQVTFLPYLVPGVAFAAAYLSMFAKPHGFIPSLYGTSYILVIALLASQMPFASRAGIAAMMQMGKDPEEAAQIVGAGWWRRVISIVLPIHRGALVAGILLPFISGIKGLSLVILLAVPGTDLLTTYAVRLLDFGYSQAANVVAIMICLIAFGGTWIGQKIGKTNLASGIGG